MLDVSYVYSVKLLKQSYFCSSTGRNYYVQYGSSHPDMCSKKWFFSLYCENVLIERRWFNCRQGAYNYYCKHNFETLKQDFPC